MVEREIGSSYVVPAGDSFQGGNLLPAQATQHAVFAPVLTGATGLEPATSGVTGRRSNQLNYAPKGSRSVAEPRRRSALDAGCECSRYASNSCVHALVSDLTDLAGQGNEYAAAS